MYHGYIVRGHQRRCSDPSASLDTWLRGGVRTKVKEPGAGRVRHPSETQDIVDKWMAGAVEIAAGDLRDQLDDGTTNPVWTMRGNTQVSLFNSGLSVIAQCPKCVLLGML